MNSADEEGYMRSVFRNWYRDLRGHTPLMWAAQRGHVQCVKFLITQKGAHVNKASRSGDTPLICAAEGGNSECLEILILAGAYVNTADYHGYSALWQAIFKAHHKCAESLIEGGADVNGAKGCEPIMAAVCTGRSECVEVLIKSGADVNVISWSFYAGLCAAGRNGYIKFGDLDKDLNPKSKLLGLKESTALIDALRLKHNVIVGLLIKARADVNVISSKSETPLMYSMLNRDQNSVNLLIQAGADVNVISANGKTPLVCSILNWDEKCADMLIKTGADVNQIYGFRQLRTLGKSFPRTMNPNTQSPLTLATMKRNTKCMELLIKAGADVNYVNAEGKTAFFMSYPCGLRYIKLLRSGAKINTVSGSGMNVYEHSFNWAEYPDKTMVLFLYAAGETLSSKRMDMFRPRTDVFNPCLKHFCRRSENIY